MDYSEKMRQMMRKLEHIKQDDKPPKFVPDPKGFFVIFVSNSELVVEHFRATYKGEHLATGSADLVITGNSAEKLCHTLVNHDLISDLRHAAYLGRELAKAEKCMREGKKYVQDE